MSLLSSRLLLICGEALTYPRRIYEELYHALGFSCSLASEVSLMAFPNDVKVTLFSLLMVEDKSKPKLHRH